MSKNKKKGKIIQLKQAQLSPESYIKTQARALPIYECFVSENWQDTGICNIIVARRHKTGNITAGFYLVDLYCLGVKDAHYEFNVDPDDYEYIKEDYGETEECEYVLTHNIIYGAIAFAEDYGFNPHQDFGIAQFILEEDDENVELIELDFGFEGIPFYMRGPNDNDAKVKYIRNTLMRTAGEGNFTVIENIDEIDDLDFDDEELDDEDDLPDDHEETLNALKQLNKIYDELIRTPEVKALIEEPFIGKNYKLSEIPILTEYRKFDNYEQEDRYFMLADIVNNAEYDQAEKAIKDAIKEYPHRPQFYNLLQTAYHFNNQFDKSNEIIIEMYKRFPDYIFARVAYANLLINTGRHEAILEVFNGKPDLGVMYPDQKAFNLHEAAIYYATMCRYFIAEDNIDSADLYMNAIIENKLYNVPGQNLVKVAIAQLCDAKMKKLKHKGVGL